MKYSKEAFASYLMGKVDEYVKQGARDTIMLNAECDGAKVRYARVPDSNSCDFCKMLGSRGFVYHSEEKANNRSKKYHPFCNCQIAVAFDVVQDSYWKNLTHVTRGHSSNSKLVAKGADGSSKLRQYEPDDLFALYQRMGSDFSPNRSKVFKKGSHLASQTESPFGSVGDMQKYLKKSVSVDDLKDRCEFVERWWNQKVYSDKYWSMLEATVHEMKQELGYTSSRKSQGAGKGPSTTWNNPQVKRLKDADGVKDYLGNEFGISVSDEFSSLPLDLQKSVVAGVAGATAKYGNSVIERIKVLSGRTANDGQFNPSSGTVRIRKNVSDGYVVAFHETVHAIDAEKSSKMPKFVTTPGNKAYSLYSEKVLKEVMKDLGLRKNSREFKDLLTEVVGGKVKLSRRYIDNPGEIVAYALDREERGRSNALSRAILERF